MLMHRIRIAVLKLLKHWKGIQGLQRRKCCVNACPLKWLLFGVSFMVFWKLLIYTGIKHAICCYCSFLLFCSSDPGLPLCKPQASLPLMFLRINFVWLCPNLFCIYFQVLTASWEVEVVPYLHAHSFTLPVQHYKSIETFYLIWRDPLFTSHRHVVQYVEGAEKYSTMQ